MQNKNVQIPYELFFQLLQFFLMDNYDGEEIIRLGLEKKLDAMVNREVYSKSKTAPTEEEREKFRQEYLDRRGIPENFRYTVFRAHSVRSLSFLHPAHTVPAFPSGTAPIRTARVPVPALFFRPPVFA